MFSKRCTLSYKTDDSNQWIVLGMGIIKMFYDSEMYGGRIEMSDDTGTQLSNTIIAVNTLMKVIHLHLQHIDTINHYHYTCFTQST